MFVPPEQLGFDFAAVLTDAVDDWSIAQPMGFTRPVVESAGDFIVAEMEASGLRRLQDTEAWFNDDATATEFRECIFSALDHWLINVEIMTAPSVERTGEYNRPCGE